MFIIVPLILIFLLFSYMKLNNLSLFGEIVIYVLMVLIVYVSYYLFKKIKNDYKIQQQNTIKIEIQELEKKLHTTKDEQSKKAYIHKIDQLKKELD